LITNFFIFSSRSLKRKNGLSGSRLVINGDRVDEPIGVSKRRRVVLNIRITVAHSRTVGTKDSAVPVTTEGQVDDDIHVAEVRRIAVATEIPSGDRTIPT